MTDRREFLKKIAKGTIYAAPVVKTLAAPDPAASQEPSGMMGPRPPICDLWDWYWGVVQMVNPIPPCPWWTDIQTAPAPLQDQAPPGATPLPKAPWSQPQSPMQPKGFPPGR